MRKFVRRTNMRRAHKKAQGYILGTIRRKGGSPRYLRQEKLLQTVATAVTNKELVIPTATDTPSDMKTPESGARLEYLNIKCNFKDLAAGEAASFILYVNPGNDTVTSADPYADYWDTTEPPTLTSDLIRKQKLEVRHIRLPNNATFPAVFTFKRKFKRPITLNQSTQVVLAVKTDSASTRTYDIHVVAMVRK